MISHYIPVMNYSFTNEIFTITLLSKEEKNNKSFTFHATKDADIPISIHYDDSIKNIKYKVLDGLYSKDLDKISYEEMYLFVVVEKEFNFLKWYKQVTKNETKSLKATLFKQILINWCNCGNNTLEDEINRLIINEEMTKRLKTDDYFSFNVLSKYSWLVELKKLKQRIPLGIHVQLNVSKSQKRMLIVDECFSGNPFDLLETTKLEKMKKDRTVISMDDHLLFSYGNVIQESKIYMIRANDLFTEEESHISYFYFPYLYKKEIITVTNLESHHEEFKENSETIIKRSSTQEEFHNMDIFYDIYENNRETINYGQCGIESYSFTLQNKNYFSEMTIPLESIFQNIHANEYIPYIEFHIGKKQDPMLRLYYKYMSSDGKKIPHLKPSIINNFMKRRTGMNSHLTLYVNNGLGNNADNYVQIILEQNGNIHINGIIENGILLTEFEPIIIQVCNYAFDSINEYLQQSGYEIEGFSSLWDPFLSVNNINYIWSFILSKKLNLEDHIGCLYALLSIEPDESKKKDPGQYYRYKRVENFKLMDDEEQLISQLLKTQRSQQDAEMIRMQLKRYYPEKSDLEIKQMIQTYVTKYRTVNGRFINRKVDTLAHAGFPISFIQSQIGSKCSINVSQIDMIQYLIFIPIYIESMLKLTQFDVPERWKTRWGKTKIEEVAIEKPDVDEKSITPFKEKEASIDEDEESVDLDDDYGDLIAGSDEDEDEEDGDNNEGNDTDDSYSGGGKHNTEKAAKYFVNRIKDRDPKLYESMEGYENVCEVNQKRQPIILTKEEKEKMDSNYKGDKPYNNALKYGKDSKGDSLYYICPQFWCTEPGKERALTKEEADSGVCGKIIKDLKNPKEGEYVYDRTHDLYKAYVPGFVKKKCYPCCFKDWNKPEQKRVRAECNKDEYAETEQHPKKERKQKIEANEKNAFILDITQREGLDQGRVAVISIPIQQFLGIDTSEDIDGHEAKENKPIFLRYGVELTPKNNQSFLAVFADLYSSQNKIQPPLTVQDFRTVLSEKITLDTFVTLQNGTLVSRFQSKKIPFNGIDIEKYKDNKLYEKIDRSNESQLDFLHYVIMSYENFIKYLNDENAKIDHVFLWDLMCVPNKEFFPNGLNLVILETLDHDITNKVRLVCPTNHYRHPLFHEKRPISIIIKNGDFYELVVYYTRIKKSAPKIEKIMIPGSNGVKKLEVILKTIRHMINKQCMPFSSKKSSYKFDTNVPAVQLYNILRELKLSVSDKVLNYKGKIIALMVKYKNGKYYLPCFPSMSEELSKLNDLWMDDVEWQSYENTVAFLRHVNNVSEQKISCNPEFRIVENGMVVGVLTKTNQFISINKMLPNVEGQFDIREMKSSNFINVDSTLSKTTSSETKFEDDSVKIIHLENEFYNVFRTTMRIIMGLFENRKDTNFMANICKSTFSYKKKLRTVADRLKRISLEDEQYKKDETVVSKSKNEEMREKRTLIKFIIFEKENLKDLQQIITCNSSKRNSVYCTVNDGKNGKIVTLLLPNKHLMTGKDNKIIYYNRLADELIRYRRVQLFMFYPYQYLNIQSQEYQVYDNEFIILKSLLTPDYLKSKKHPYGNHGETIPYEDAELDTKEQPGRVTVNLVKETEDERRLEDMKKD
jgi:hypothetical protein